MTFPYSSWVTFHPPLFTYLFKVFISALTRFVHTHNPHRARQQGESWSHPLNRLWHSHKALKVGWGSHEVPGMQARVNPDIATDCQKANKRNINETQTKSIFKHLWNKIQLISERSPGLSMSNWQMWALWPEPLPHPAGQWAWQPWASLPWCANCHQGPPWHQTVQQGNPSHGSHGR